MSEKQFGRSASADLKNDHSNKDFWLFEPPENFRNHQDEQSKKKLEPTLGLGDMNLAQYSDSCVH